MRKIPAGLLLLSVLITSAVMAQADRWQQRIKYVIDVKVDVKYQPFCRNGKTRLHQ
jgi:hypothetical protein